MGSCKLQGFNTVLTAQSFGAKQNSVSIKWKFCMIIVRKNGIRMNEQKRKSVGKFEKNHANSNFNRPESGFSKQEDHRRMIGSG